MSAALWLALAVGWLVCAVIVAIDVWAFGILFGFGAGMCFGFAIATRLMDGRWWR